MEPRGLACWYFALKSNLTFLSVPCLAGHEWCQAGSVTDPLTWDDLSCVCTGDVFRARAREVEPALGVTKGKNISPVCFWSLLT